MGVLSIGDALKGLPQNSDSVLHTLGSSRLVFWLNKDVLKECCGIFGNTIIFWALPIVR